MATTTIPWGDGSGDNIYLTYPSASGDQNVQVSSDANTGGARTKTVTFIAGNVSQALTVNQSGVPQQYTVTFNPSSYNSGGGSVTNPSNGYTAETSSSYAQIQVTKTANASSYIYWNFDTSSIPANATIDSVSCKAKAYVTNLTTAITATIQMYSGSTAKGSSQNLTNSSKTFTFSGETWSHSELGSARVRVNATRNSGASTNNMRFYGATLTIKYTV